MKIGIDIRAIGQQRTGDEYYTLNLVRELLKIDKKNQYFLLTNTENADEIKTIEKKIFSGIENSEAKIISVLPKSKLFWTFFSLPRMAKKLDLDVLHVQYITPLWLPKKIKLITTIADISFKVYPEFISKSDLFFLKILIPLSLKRADKIIAVSNFTKNEIVKYYGIKTEKISAIHNGSAGELFFSKKMSNSTEIFKKTGIKKPFLFYVGTHQPRKDLPTLIKAFVELKTEFSNNPEIKNLQLVIGGKIKAHNYDLKIDQTLTEIKSNSKQKVFLKDLIFTGYLTDQELIVLHREAEIFVFPSLYEGFGLPLIEAMASETPVVCSDIECFKEVAGKGARFYEAGNEKELQKALFEVIMSADIKKKLIKEGKENAQKYSWEKTALETLQLL